jgi:hypothetical protein
LHFLARQYIYQNEYGKYIFNGCDQLAHKEWRNGLPPFSQQMLDLLAAENMARAVRWWATP